MFFDGDIIITDPCYIMKPEIYFGPEEPPNLNDFFSEEYKESNLANSENILERASYLRNLLQKRTEPKAQLEKKKYDEAYRKWSKEREQDWDKCHNGFNMEELGFKDYLTADTIYGDWSCTTFELKELKSTRYLHELRQVDFKSEILGQFCADSGLVSVFLLEEVLKYNPNFDFHINNKHTTTWIKNFKGNISIETETNENDEQEVFVCGEGNINFITRQTGF